MEWDKRDYQCHKKLIQRVRLGKWQGATLDNEVTGVPLEEMTFEQRLDTLRTDPLPLQNVRYRQTERLVLVLTRTLTFLGNTLCFLPNLGVCGESL